MTLPAIENKLEKSRIYNAVLLSVIWLVISWVAFLLDNYLGFTLNKYGLEPRELGGLIGIITMPFLHSNWEHLIQNSLAILVLNTMLFYFYRPLSFQVFFQAFFITPILLWIVGRNGNHIGASAILYFEFGFMVLSGIIRKNPILMRAALVVILYYGSLVWYVFPIDKNVSWEGHACGLIVGIALSLINKNRGPQRKIFQYETEPELPDDENAYWKVPELKDDEKGAS